jgi:hypothetical protein
MPLLMGSSTDDWALSFRVAQDWPVTFAASTPASST